MIATDIVDPARFNHGPNTWLLKVLEFVFISGSKMGAHCPMMISDDYTAPTGWMIWINSVLGMNTF